MSNRSFVVNACTSLNMVLGLATVYLAFHGCLTAAACCMLGSVIWDSADGILARRWKVASDFGAQLDSLADLTSFGVGGAALVLAWFSPPLPLWVMLPVASAVALMAAWRLARFNAHPPRPGEFQGVPTTAMATMTSVTYLTYPQLCPYCGALLACLLAALMVSPLPYPKFSKPTDLPIWFLLLLPLAGYYNLYWTLWGCSILYLLSGPVIWWQRRRPPVLPN